MKKIIITIDGPAGSGKGRIAKYIAKKYNFIHIDSGLLYRKTAKSLVQSGQPRSINSNTLAIDALDIMEKHGITSLFVYSDEKTDSVPDGIVHIHDILRTKVM